MPGGFSFTAQMQLTAPNLKSFTTSVQSQLNNISGTINIKFPRGIDDINAQVKSLQSSLNATSQINPVANASRSVKATANDFRDASTAASQFGELVGSSIRKFTAFSLAAGSVLSLVGAIKEGTKEALVFQREMIRLEQVGGNLSNSVGGIAGEIGRLSTTLGASSSELSKVAVTLRQAGLSSEDTRVSLDALAKSTLAPTFSNITNTVEGAVAVIQQFGVQAKDLTGILGSVNAVSAAFAVESDDIVHAVRRSGGAFKAAGGNLNELISLFTSVRQTTRESAETIASGFNTIFARAQRSDTVEKLKELGINLRFSAREAELFGKSEGEFVGPYEAVRRLNTALKNVPPASAQYAAIVEELGGFRQVSKVIPLIQQFGKAEQALGVSLGGTNSLTQSSILAQKGLLQQVSQLKEQFLDLFRVLAEDKAFQSFAHLLIDVGKGAVALAKALAPLAPLITILAAAKIGSVASNFTKTGFGQGLAKGLRKNTPTGASGLARGGPVPGFGDKDETPIMATPGEFVVKKSSARSIGYGDLHRMNKTGKIPHYAEGGPIRDPKKSAYVFEFNNVLARGSRPTKLAALARKRSEEGHDIHIISDDAENVDKFTSSQGINTSSIISKRPNAALKGLRSQYEDIKFYGSDRKRVDSTKSIPNVKSRVVKPQETNITEDERKEVKKSLNIQDRTGGKLLNRVTISPPGGKVAMLVTGTQVGVSSVKTPVLPITNLGRDAQSIFKRDKEELVNSGALSQKQADSITNVTVPIAIRSPQEQAGSKVRAKITQHILNSLDDLASSFSSSTAGINITKKDSDDIIKNTITSRTIGRIFEGFLQTVSLKTKGSKGNSQSLYNNFDFNPIAGSGLTELFGQDLNGLPGEVKLNDTADARVSVVSKALREFGIAKNIGLSALKLENKLLDRKGEPVKYKSGEKKGQEITGLDAYRARFHDTTKKFAIGGLVPGRGTKDDFPAHLQRGEFVMRQRAVDLIGPQTLDNMNRKPEKFAAGGLFDDEGIGGVDVVYLRHPDSKRKINPAISFADRKKQTFTVRNAKGQPVAIPLDEAQDFAEGKIDHKKYGLTSQLSGSVTKRQQELDKRKEGLNNGVLSVPFSGDSLGLIGVGSLARHGAISKINDVPKELKDSPVGTVFKEKGIKKLNTKYITYGISDQATSEFRDEIAAPVTNSIASTFQSKFGGDPAQYKLTSSELGTVEGYLYEKYIRSISKTKFENKAGGDLTFDYPHGLGNDDNFSKVVIPHPITAKYIDAKYNADDNKLGADLARKYFNQIGAEKTKANLAAQGFAKGGASRREANAILMRGEYVLGADSARKIGYDKLNKLNKEPEKFASGGIFSGIKKLAGKSVVKKAAKLVDSVKDTHSYKLATETEAGSLPGAGTAIPAGIALELAMKYGRKKLGYAEGGIFPKGINEVDKKSILDKLKELNIHISPDVVKAIGVGDPGAHDPQLKNAPGFFDPLSQNVILQDPKNIGSVAHNLAKAHDFAATPDPEKYSSEISGTIENQIAKLSQQHLYPNQPLRVAHAKAVQRYAAYQQAQSNVAAKLPSGLTPEKESFYKQPGVQELFGHIQQSLGPKIPELNFPTPEPTSSPVVSQAAPKIPSFPKESDVKQFGIDKVTDKLRALNTDIPTVGAVSKIGRGDPSKFLGKKFKGFSGAFSTKDKSVVVNDEENLPLVAHELAHAHDYNLGGNDFSSNIPGSKHHEVAQLAIQHLNPEIYSKDDKKAYSKLGVNLDTDHPEAFAQTAQHHTIFQQAQANIAANKPSGLTPEQEDVYNSEPIQKLFGKFRESIGAKSKVGAEPTTSPAELPVKTQPIESVQETESKAPIVVPKQTKPNPQLAVPKNRFSSRVKPLDPDSSRVNKNQTQSILPHSFLTPKKEFEDVTSDVKNQAFVDRSSYRATPITTSPKTNTNKFKPANQDEANNLERQLGNKKIKPEGPGCCEKILKGLREVVAAINKNGVGGSGTGNTTSIVKAEKPGEPEKPKIIQTKEKSTLGERFRNYGGTAAILASQFAPQLIDQALGTPETQKKGDTVLGFNKSAVGAGLGGAVSGVGLGVSTGALLGPLGAVIGGFAGGIYGLVSSLKDAETKIREISIDKELDALGKTIDRVVSEEGKLSNSGVAAIRGGFASINKGARESADPNAFLSEKVNVSQIQGVLTKVITSADLTGKESASERKQKIESVSGGIGGEALNILAKLPENANKTFNELFKQFDELAVKVGLENERAKTLESFSNKVEIQTKNFDRLGQAITDAVTNLDHLDSALVTTTSAFEGSHQLQATNRFSTGAAGIGTSNVKAFNDSVDLVTSSLNRVGLDVSKNFGDALKGTNIALKNLPAILGSLASEGTLSQDNLESRFRSSTERIAPGVDKGIRENVSQAFGTIPLDDINKNIKNNPQKIIDEITSKLASTTQALDPAVKALENAINSFAGNLNKYQELSTKAEEAQHKAVDAQVELASEQFRTTARRGGFKDLDVPVGLQQTSFNVRQQNLAGVVGQNSFNPQILAARLSGVNEKITGKTAELNTTTDKTRITQLQNELSNLGTTSNKLRGALEHLADSASRNAAINERLAKINEEEAGRLSIAEEYAVASPQDRQKLNATALAANRVSNTGNLEEFGPELRAAILEFSHKVDNIPTQALHGQTGSEFRQRILQNNIVPSLGGPAVPLNLRSERNNLENERIANLNAAAQAQTELAKSLTSLKDSFFSQLQSNQKQFLNNLEKNLLESEKSRLEQQKITPQLELGKVDQQKGAFGKLQEFGLTRANVGDAGKVVNNPDIKKLQEGLKKQEGLSKANISNIGSTIQQSDVENLKTTHGLRGFGDPRGLPGEGYFKISNDEKGTNLRDKLTANVIKNTNDQLSRSTISNRIVEPALEDFGRLDNKERNPEKLQDLVKFYSQHAISRESSITQSSNKSLQTGLKEQTGLGDYQINAIAGRLDEFTGYITALGPDFSTLAKREQEASSQLEKLTASISGLNDKIAGVSGETRGTGTVLAGPEPARSNLDELTKKLGASLPFASLAKGGRGSEATRMLYGSDGKDTKLALLSPKETVINEKGSEKHRNLLDRINSGKPIGMATGGLIRRRPEDEDYEYGADLDDFGRENILSQVQPAAPTHESRQSDIGITKTYLAERNKASGFDIDPDTGARTTASVISVASNTISPPYIPEKPSVEDVKKNNSGQNFLNIAKKALASGNYDNARRFYGIAQQAGVTETLEIPAPIPVGFNSEPAFGPVLQGDGSESRIDPDKILSKRRKNQISGILSATQGRDQKSFTIPELRNAANIQTLLKKTGATESKHGKDFTSSPIAKALEEENKRRISTKQQLVTPNQRIPGGISRKDRQQRLQQDAALNASSPLISVDQADIGKLNQPFVGPLLPPKAKPKKPRGATINDLNNQQYQNFEDIQTITKKRRAPTINQLNQQAFQAYGFADGGIVVSPDNHSGYIVPGFGTGDHVHALLTPGERVVPVLQSREQGHVIDHIIKGGQATKRFAAGLTGEALAGNVGGGNNTIGSGDWTKAADSIAKSSNDMLAASQQFNQLVAPLNAFAQSAGQMITPLTQFNVASTNLGVGLTSFVGQVPALVEGLKALANIPSTITISGSINPVPINVNITQEISEATKQQIMGQVIAQLKGQLKSGDLL